MPGVGARVNAAIAADWQAIYGADDAPSDAAPVPPETSPPAGEDAGRTRQPRETRDDAPNPESGTQPESVTLTAAEVALLRRQAADQAATARRLAENQREMNRLRLENEGRAAALDQLRRNAEQREAQGLGLSRTDVLNEEFRVRNYVEGELSKADAAERQEAEHSTQIVAQKEAAALPAYSRAMVALIQEGAPLGLSESEIQAVIAKIAAEDDDAKDFQGEYERATNVDAATQAANRFWRAVTRAGKVAIQARKMAEISEAAPSEPRLRRTQAHGTGGNVAVDPLARLPLGERARRRVEDALAADTRAMYPQE